LEEPGCKENSAPEYWNEESLAPRVLGLGMHGSWEGGEDREAECYSTRSLSGLKLADSKGVRCFVVRSIKPEQGLGRPLPEDFILRC
jgi:hypothetical protein